MSGPPVVSPRGVLRAACEQYGHAWSVCGAPLGAKRCRVCARLEADLLWLPFMDEPELSERVA